MVEWIGKPTNFFKPVKTKSVNFFGGPIVTKDVKPVKMFGDYDRDGVMNAFDCSPHNKHKQGFIDAVVGAVKGIGKGGVKAGWKEGMAKPGVIERYREKRRAAQIQRMIQPRMRTYPTNKPMPTESPQIRTYGKVTSIPSNVVQAVRSKMQMDSTSGFRQVTQMPKQSYDSTRDAHAYTLTKIPTDQELKVERVKETIRNQRQFLLNKAKQAEAEARANLEARDREDAEMRTAKIKQQGYKNYKAVEKKANRFLLALKRSNPKYDMNVEYRGRRIAEMQNALEDPYISDKQKAAIRRRLGKTMMVQESRMNQLSKTARGQAIRSGIKTIVEVFPGVTAYSGKKDHVLGAPGQRGRPRGSVDPRYRAFGGVYGYRRAMAAQKKAQKLAMQQAQQQNRMQQAVQQAPYEYQQQDQVPQEMQQVPQQVMPQQVVMQTPPQPQQREIATVFKGSGGKPYPAVDNTPLASSRATIPYGYVEAVDSFTGRRFLKKLPPAERWSGDSRQEVVRRQWNI